MEIQYGHISAHIYIPIKIISAQKSVFKKENYEIENVLKERTTHPPPRKIVYIWHLSHCTTLVEQNTQELLSLKSLDSK